MQLTTNGFRAGIIAVGIALLTVAGASATAVAANSEKEIHDAAYLENIITVLRAHVKSMRAIIDNDDLKYADNMLRHANAFERAIGMVGPMDWHANSAFEKIQASGNPTGLTEAEFEELARASDRRVEAINRAANRYLQDKDGERMHNAIDSMIASCGACHSRLPSGTVPSVWNGMQH